MIWMDFINLNIYLPGALLHVSYNCMAINRLGKGEESPLGLPASPESEPYCHFKRL